MLAVLMPSRSKEPVPMLTQGEDVEAHALKERGWSISAIARHLDRDRKTIRGYLNGDRWARSRATSGPGSPMTITCGLRRSTWATALYEEVAALGYARSYPTFVRQILTVDDAWPLMARGAPWMSVASPPVGTSARESEWSRGGPSRGQGGAARLGTRTFWR